jgi:hypothetical protein
MIGRQTSCRRISGGLEVLGDRVERGNRTRASTSRRGQPRRSDRFAASRYGEPRKAILKSGVWEAVRSVLRAIGCKERHCPRSESASLARGAPRARSGRLRAGDRTSWERAPERPAPAAVARNEVRGKGSAGISRAARRSRSQSGPCRVPWVSPRSPSPPDGRSLRNRPARWRRRSLHSARQCRRQRQRGQRT